MASHPRPEFIGLASNTGTTGPHTDDWFTTTFDVNAPDLTFATGASDAWITGPGPSNSGQNQPAQPVASTSRTQQQPHPGLHQQQQQHSRKMKKKKPGRGRLMTVKIFYSLTSPRFNAATSASPAAPAAISQSNAFSSPFDTSATTPSSNSPSPSVETSRPQSASHKQQGPGYTCLARLSAPVWVQLLGSPPPAIRSGAQQDESHVEYGKVTLKTCLSAICISRPELVTDPSQDYAISALDPYESSLQPGPSLGAAGSNSNAATGGQQGLMEGKGMLSWTLAERREGTTFVCGRVVLNEEERERQRRKRRRLERMSVFASRQSGDEDDDEDDDDDESEDEGAVKETLEVWLQLVERPTLTQSQFLTSLRSFADPAQWHASSDHPSSPPRRAMMPPSATAHPRSANSVGDPVKRKRPRESDERRLPVMLPAPSSAASVVSPLAADLAAAPSPFAPPPPIIAETAAAATGPTLEQLQDPRVRALLAQIIPSLSAAGGSGDAKAPPLALDSEYGRQLLPALQTLAQYYNVDLTNSVAFVDSLPGLLGSLTSNIGSAGPIASENGVGSASNRMGAGQSHPSANGITGDRTSNTTGPASQRRDVFAPIEQNSGPNDRSNPVDASGCSNCKRKKSALWRESRDERGQRVTVCNACGVYYNKHGQHRSSKNSISPQRDGSTASGPRGARPLQGRLTLTCEQESKKHKARKHSSGAHSASSLGRIPGLVAPPSPSKVVGPNRSPGNSFGAWAAHSPRYGQHAMTSPGRSPRRSSSAVNAMFGFPATSPARNTRSGANALVGLRSGYESGGDGRGDMPNFAADIFGGDQSPSPEKPSDRQMPTYMLTASPGTALDRILNETNIDLYSFDMSMPDAVEHDKGIANEANSENNRPMLLRSSQLAPTDVEDDDHGPNENGGTSDELNFDWESGTEAKALMAWMRDQDGDSPD